jgi:serine/threonine protein kinase
MVFGIPPFYT